MAYRAKGDGTTIDTPAINKAIEDANASGGGTVNIPAGVYACYSIHLKSNVALYLEPGATILAASVAEENRGRVVLITMRRNQQAVGELPGLRP